MYCTYIYLYIICIDISSIIIYDMFCNWTNKLEVPTCTSHTQIHISSSVDWERIREANTSSPNLPKFSRNSFLPLKCPMRWNIIVPMRMAFRYVWLKWGKIVSSLTRPSIIYMFINLPCHPLYVMFILFGFIRHQSQWYHRLQRYIRSFYCLDPRAQCNGVQFSLIKPNCFPSFPG